MTALPSLDRADDATRVTSLRTQHPSGLLGVPGDGLRLTWTAESGASVRQLGYQLSWSDDGRNWTDEMPQPGEASMAVSAPGGTIPSGSGRHYRVRLATEHGWSGWSPAIAVEAAIDGIRGEVISVPTPVEGPSPYLRREFDVREGVQRARLRVASLGLNEVVLNGARVGDEHVSPGWTAYQERVVFATHDVAPYLRPGWNAIGAVLADGWYRGRLGWKGETAHYGTELGLLAELEIHYEDGSIDIVSTDSSWRASEGSVRMSSIYDGCDLDLGREPAGWDLPGFDDSAWAAVGSLEVDRSLFRPRLAPPVRTIAEFPGRLERRGHDTRVVLDQNIAGWLRLTVRGRSGDRVVARHAEVLEPDGALHVSALRTARAVDTYILDRDGEHVLEPRFTFHGFQFADVSGAEVVDATGIAISSDTPQRATFSSSLPELDRLHENVVWSQRDNFVSVPTDCPQRDERLGWTGDAQAFAPTASTLTDSESFWRSWLIDLEIDQSPSGAVAAVVPNIIDDADFDSTGQSGIMGRAGWADAATIVPWSVYVSTGSDEVLSQQLGSMRRWVEHLVTRAAGHGGILLPSEFQFGDWLDPDAPGDRPHLAKTSGDFLANAFFSWSARLLARAERIVGDAERAIEADELADRVAAATWAQWSDHASGTQTGCAVAIEFGIAPASERAELGERLAALVRADRGRIATGFLGTPLVLPALSRTGHHDEAYLMLLRREAPSWLYEVERGATTIWERWDAILPDGSINSGDMAQGDTMLSFNHYAYGAVIDWVYRTVAGLAPDDTVPGYRLVDVAPRPAVGLTRAGASIDSALGEVAIDWSVERGALEIDLVVPFGARARLDLLVEPGSAVLVNGLERTPDVELTAGRYRIEAASPRIADPAQALAVAAEVAS